MDFAQTRKIILLGKGTKKAWGRGYQKSRSHSKVERFNYHGQECIRTEVQITCWEGQRSLC